MCCCQAKGNNPDESPLFVPEPVLNDIYSQPLRHREVNLADVIIDRQDKGKRDRCSRIFENFI